MKPRASLPLSCGYQTGIPSYIVARTSNFEDIKIRLYGIDAPETNQSGGAEARDALARLKGLTIVVYEMDVDRYSRFVALIEHQGRSVNLDLAAKGLAWFYPQYCKLHPICGEVQKAEGETRDAKKGLWAGEPVKPWEWRKR